MKGEFRENRCSDRHTTRKGVNEFPPAIPYFLNDFDEIWYRKISAYYHYAIVSTIIVQLRLYFT